MSYSYFKSGIEKILFDKNKMPIVLLISLFSFFVLKKYETAGYMYYELLSMLFCIVILTVSLLFSLKSKILKWFGDNLFWVYILQRIPMLIFAKTAIVNHPYRYFLLSFTLTIILAYIYNHVFKYVDNILFAKKQK